MYCVINVNKEKNVFLVHLNNPQKYKTIVVDIVKVV